MESRQGIHRNPDSDKSLKVRRGSAAFNLQLGANAECGLIHQGAAGSTVPCNGSPKRLAEAMMLLSDDDGMSGCDVCQDM